MKRGFLFPANNNKPSGSKEDQQLGILRDSRSDAPCSQWRPELLKSFVPRQQDVHNQEKVEGLVQVDTQDKRPKFDGIEEKVNNTGKANPYAHMPLYPHKATHSPIVALDATLAKTSTDNCYYCWSNGDPKKLRFTAVFVHPTTGEIFEAGAWLQDKDPITDAGNTCWFTSKKSAKHGAAARAYDCLNFRTEQEMVADYDAGLVDQATFYPTKFSRLGLASPYVDKRYNVPESAPLDVQEKIQRSTGADQQDSEIFPDLLPIVTASPAQELQKLMDQYPGKEKVSTTDYYHFWCDESALAHARKFSAAFVHPHTAEVFLAGACSRAVPSTEHDMIHWFPSKKLAKSAVAARAYDCLKFRRERDLGVSPRLSLEEPYLDAVYVLPELAGIPLREREMISTQQREIRLEKYADAGLEEEEAAWHRPPRDDDMEDA